MSRQRRAAPSISAEAPTAARRSSASSTPPASPARPTSASAGALTPSRRISDQRLLRSMPTMGVSVTPDARGSTRKSERPSGARAGTSTTSATCAHGTKRLSPVSRQLSLVFVAVAAVEAGTQSSDSSRSAAPPRARAGPPGGGATPVERVPEQPRPRARLSRGDRGQPLLLLGGAAAQLDAEAAQHHAGEVRARVRRAAHLLQHERQLDQSQPGAALLLREGQAQPAELGHLAPERLGVAPRVIGHGTHVGRGALLVQRRADGVAEQDLIFAERE